MASEGKDLVGRGVVLMTVLTEGSSPAKAATRLNLDSWIIKVPTYHTASLDAKTDGMDTPLEPFFGVQRDMFFVIDVKTMKVLDVFNADPRAAIQAAKDLLDAGK